MTTFTPKINPLTRMDVVAILLDSHFKETSSGCYKLDNYDWCVGVTPDDGYIIVGTQGECIHRFHNDNAPIKLLIYLLLKGCALSGYNTLVVSLLGNDYRCTFTPSRRRGEFTSCELRVYNLFNEAMCNIVKQTKSLMENINQNAIEYKYDLKLSAYINSKTYEVGTLHGCFPISHNTECYHDGVCNSITLSVDLVRTKCSLQ